IKGFGNFEEGEEDYWNNAKLKREYTHPAASIVGKWEGPPIVDGRVKNRDTLDEMMHKAVEESLAITVEGTLHDIRQMGYEIAVPVKGDRVFLMDERINLDQEIRVQAVKTTYDERDNIIGCEVTFGSESIRQRHKASINSLSKNFQDLIEGKLKLPIISLEQIGRDMIKNIHDASSEIVFGDFGMQAISKTNPNHVFGVNSEGWYISQDGGATPKTIATAKGIYADALFAGTLWLTNEMNIESADGYLNITGSLFKMTSRDDSNLWTEISPSGLTTKGSLTIIRPDAYIDNGVKYGYYMENGLPKLNFDLQRNQFMHSGIVTFTGQRYQISGDDSVAGQAYNLETFNTVHKAKNIRVDFNMGISGIPSSYVKVEVVELGGSVVATHNRFVRETDDYIWGRIDFSIGVPNYSDGNGYYIRAGSSVVS